MLYYIGRIIVIFLKNRYYNVKARGLENIPAEGGAILAANHNDRSDPPFLIATIKRRIYLLGEKRALETARKYSIFLRPFVSFGGHLSIERGKGKSTIVLLKAKRLLDEGKLFCIFPEGTTKGGEKILSGKTGVARLALMSKKPVIPIAIKGTYGIITERYEWKNLNKNKDIEIRIGKPLFFDKYYGMENDRETLRNITNQIMRQIRILYSTKKF